MPIALFSSLFSFLFVFLSSASAFAQEKGLIGLDETELENSPMGQLLFHPISYLAIAVFVVAYFFVLVEEKTCLRKSKPVMIAAALIWALVSYVVHDVGMDMEDLHMEVNETLAHYAGLLLFLLSAMTFISALEERQVFDALRSKLVEAGLNYRQLFWVTGGIAFFLSPLADNMTTALVMGAIVMALIRDDAAMLTIFMVNIVNAANAGGAFSPFGDITTLMVWQAGKIEFFDFLMLFLPSVACFSIPAFLMSFWVPKTMPEKMVISIPMKTGGKRLIALGLFTIALAIFFEQVLGLPSFLGMMLGLGLLLVSSYLLERKAEDRENEFDVFSLMHATEWDTLLFFFGVIFCISGLGYLGYLDVLSTHMYGTIGADISNIVIGVASAVVDNIPLMFAVISMEPDMSEFHWLLLTLTLGIGGSLLSIGSAAGIALMGVSKGQYTFLSHLKWTFLLVPGYAAAIAVHYLINGQ
jgi:Na+/H+ antiporter NhaD/arsenite permease-like protein